MKRAAKNKSVYLMLSTILLSAAMLIVSLTLSPSNAKYVTEVGDGSTDYETQMPADIKSQQDLFNAITSGYSYVKLSEALDGPIIMTGEQLELTNNLVIDLNGQEITRNDRKSILTVPTDKELTVVDTGRNAGGGLYNPIGSVLTVAGGRLNVYGGTFESGPRPSEYYGNLLKTNLAESVKEVRTVGMLNSDGSLSGERAAMPVFPIRGGKSGNVYFDVPFVSGGRTLINRDTYCFVATSSGSDNELSLLDVSKAEYAYKYIASTDGTWLRPADGAETAESEIEVMVFAYENDIAASMTETETDPVTREKTVPNYAAVSMQGGELNVNVRATDESLITEAGSFYSYFGTWHTYCVFMNGGMMNVSTSGKFETVNPESLTDFDANTDTRENSAKFAENACILCAKGTLNIDKIGAANSFNGSVISVSGGIVNIRNTKIMKNVTLSHSDSPYFADDILTDGRPSEFPTGRQYRDAALFINGGALNIDETDVTVNKNITDKYPLEKSADGVRPMTTFGILSRGRSQTDGGEFVGDSSLIGRNVNFLLKGSKSYGVYATRGTVELTGTGSHADTSADKRGVIKLESDESCYGVYAENKVPGENAAKILLKNYRVEIGEELTYIGAGPTGKRAASIGVYLDSRIEGGSVTLDNTGIHSQEMGIAVDGGSLTFINGGTIHAFNASAVGLRGGDIVFDPAEEADDGFVPNDYDIKCYINARAEASGQCKVWTENATAAGTHLYEIYVPWQDSSDTYENTNAIRVFGGSLIATKKSKLNIEFRGLFNDYDMYKVEGITSTSADNIYFDNIVIKSFAVACTDESGGSDKTEISLQHANIMSHIGGGIKVAGGLITLGDETSGAGDIVVNTLGNQHYYRRSVVSDAKAESSYYTWHFYPNLGGGHAIVARDGRMNVYNGTYTAVFGNGAAATGNNATVNIYGGTFKGNMEHSETIDVGGSTVVNRDASGRKSSDSGCYSSVHTSQWGTKTYATNLTGPASHYGIKVMGNATVNIYGGTFDGENGGMYIRGDSTDKHAGAYIYEGKFGTNPTVGGGQDGIVVSEHSEIYLGAYTKSALEEKSWLDNNGKIASESNVNTAKLQVHAGIFPVSVNTVTDSGKDISYSHDVTVKIFYGYYKSSNTTSRRGYGHIDAYTNYATFKIFNHGLNSNLVLGYTGTADYGDDYKDPNGKITRVRVQDTNFGLNPDISCDENTAAPVFFG